jgi:hypothetical protein
VGEIDRPDRRANRAHLGIAQEKGEVRVAATLQLVRAGVGVELRRGTFQVVLDGNDNGSIEWLGLQGSAKASQAFPVKGVPHPFPATVAVHEAGLAQDPEVVGDGRLGLAGGPHEGANTNLAIRSRCPHREDPEPYGVGQRAEALGHVGGLFGAQRGSQHRRAANRLGYLADSTRFYHH